ncbi:hypothetical protein [Cellvibrio sp. OA-2007]|uniref:hypothetical protein n=1 Tax=Cellvibrio sp. OA-2007 TaxID=529823 RepID=UPI000B1C01D5|nr:hypothetical protein [Cellvibrio sp. OA-2007]
MKIYFSENSDPMLLSTRKSLEKIGNRILEFSESPENELTIKAETNGSPEPYAELLPGIRIRKSETDHTLYFGSDRYLELEISKADLQAFCATFSLKETSHRHWYSGPISLIIEAA